MEYLVIYAAGFSNTSCGIGEQKMINFEEEIEKFKPSLEVDQAEDAICNNDVADVTDIIRDLLQEMKKK